MIIRPEMFEGCVNQIYVCTHTHTHTHTTHIYIEKERENEYVYLPCFIK